MLLNSNNKPKLSNKSDKATKIITYLETITIQFTLHVQTSIKDQTIKGQSKRQPNIGYHILISITLLLVLNIIPTIKSLHINLKMILSALMEQVQDTLVMEVGVLLKEVVQLIKSVLQQSLNFMMPKTPIIFG